MITTVEELISALAKYPKNMKVYSNLITQNLKGELVMEHQRTPEEEKKKSVIEELNTIDSETDGVDNLDNLINEYMNNKKFSNN